MIDRNCTPNMIAAAEILLARSTHWSRGTAVTEDGLTVGVVIFNSSRTTTDADGKETTVRYLTRCDGACCDCPGFKMRQACSHAVAAKMDAERAREAAVRKPLDIINEMFDRQLDERTQTVSAF